MSLQVERIVDQVIADNPEKFEKAKTDDAYVGALRNECLKYSRGVSPLVFSQAIRRRIEAKIQEE